MTGGVEGGSRLQNRQSLNGNTPSSHLPARYCTQPKQRPTDPNAMMVRSPTTRATPLRNNGLQTARTAVLGLSKVLFLSLSAAAAPVRSGSGLALREHNDGDDPDSPGASLWVLYVASLILVLLGGAFAGLTIAYVLMELSILGEKGSG